MLEGSILQQLRDAHQSEQPNKRPLNFGVYYKNTLVALCHALEDAILDADYAPLMITAFQRGKWYLEEANRYGDIAERSQQIVIMAASDAGFADHPTSQRSNVALVNLDRTDPVAQEWHLIIFSPNYTAMVLCQELSEDDYSIAGLPKDDLERKFYGFWTFEPGLVRETTELAIAHVGRYDSHLQQQLMAQVEAIANQVPSDNAHLPVADHLDEIVARVVEYLQTRHQDLGQAAPSYVAQSHTHNLDNNLVSNELQALLRMAQLIDQTDLSNPLAAAEVATLVEAMGQLLDLPAWQLHRLRLAGLLHRLAFPMPTVLGSGSSTRYDEDSVPLTCPLVPGIQVLRKMQRLRAIAAILTHQAEWWNGSGHPGRLAGDEIPIESRILGLVTYFQQQLARLRYQHTNPQGNLTVAPDELLNQALADCQIQQGDRWDPKLIEVLELLVRAMQQGVDLPVALPKIAAGMWLLDSHSEEELMLSYQELGDLRIRN
jgi:DICT domain-containing protein